MKDDLKNDDITYFEDVVVNEPVVETKRSNRKKITKNIEKEEVVENKDVIQEDVVQNNTVDPELD